MTVLVTGGAGFIGSSIVDLLVHAGHRVRLVDARPTVDPHLNGVEVVRADLRDRTATAAALRDVDAVCHQAAKVGLGLGMEDAPDYVGSNDLATAVLLAEMERRGVQQLVLASSMVVYGEGGYRCRAHGSVRPAPRRVADLDAGRFDPPCPQCGAQLTAVSIAEDAATDPRNVYAATKLAQEHLAASWARLTGGRVIALRYHNVYGPRMPRNTPYAGVASIFRSALAAGAAPRVFEDGRQRRDFVHVEDVARANGAAVRALSAGNGPRSGELRAYNVGSGQVHMVGEMATALAAVYGGPAPVVTGDYRRGDVRHITASSDRIARELRWRAVISFADGMAEFARDDHRDAVRPRG
jgi:dTDP-L-rhamnose 4-epimerase